MSNDLVAQLDLDLAWRRAKADTPARLFVRAPFFTELVEVDLARWLRELHDELESGRYNPAPAEVCDVPKANAEVRPGSILSVTDRVVYAACVGSCLREIKTAFNWTDQIVDFAYRLSDDPARLEWFRSQFGGWDKFREESLAKIEDEGVSYVVVADIAGFYENVDIGILVSDLRQVGASDEVVNLLSRCLNRWAQVPGRGLPQGHSPSDVLGKLYLNSLDYSLRALGLKHYRYVDDIRVFCATRVEAKRAIVELSRLLRSRGLNIQSAKLRILRADAARRYIEGIAPIIKTISKRFVMSIAGVDDPYANVWDAEELLRLKPDEAPLEILRETYRTYFVDVTQGRFNASLFRFLLRRLGRQGDDFAVQQCVTLLEKRPEVTEPILEYWQAVDATQVVEPQIVAFMNSADAVYSYQLYQIIEWRGRLDEPPSDAFLAIARRFAFDRAQPHFLRSVARRLLAQFGNAADLETLQREYPYYPPREQAEILCCLRGMETGRRNAFLARCMGDGPLQQRAVMWVRAQAW